MIASGPDYLRVGFYLLVKNGEGAVDHSLDEHPDQYAFRRPIGEGAIDFASVLHRHTKKRPCKSVIYKALKVRGMRFYRTLFDRL